MKVGHVHAFEGVTPKVAVRIVLACGGRYRLPEPIRQADMRSRASARA